MKVCIYLDMNGVLCDFNKAYNSYKPEVPDCEYKFARSVIYDQIFKKLEVLPDAPELLEFVANIAKNPAVDVQILTSVGTKHPMVGKLVQNQKIQWLQSHNIHYKTNFVVEKVEKSQYANNHSILIDDSIGCIQPFNDVGGCGILHVSANESIRELSDVLKRLGVE